jgi:hypothetical protein
MSSAIITTTFLTTALRFTITEDLICKEHIPLLAEAKEFMHRSYELYDIKENVVHIVDIKKMNRKVLPMSEYTIGGWLAGNKEEVLADVTYDILDGYKCLVEKKDVNSSTPIGDSTHAKFTYFAEIPFLEKILNTDDKLRFCGFISSHYRPFLFDIHQFLKWDEVDIRSDIKRTHVVRGNCDSSLISTILSIPEDRQ